MATRMPRCSLRPVRLARPTPAPLGHPRRAPAPPRATPPASSSAGKEGETADAARERRLRESARVEERLVYVDSLADVRAEMDKAGDRLVVLEVQSASVCDSGLCEEAELVWKEDVKAAEAAARTRCQAIKHTFARTARDCPSVVFLSLDADGEAGAAAAAELGVQVLPTVQFWKGGAKLWEHRGFTEMEQDLGEGVLFYGDAAAGGERASQYVTEVADADALAAWAAALPPRELGVLFVSSTRAAACVHIFPAVLALARNMGGFASFARLVSDGSAEASAATAALGVKDVPTFVFYRGGAAVGKHVGAARGDLIGQILAQQAAAGIAPPPPPPRVAAKARG